MRPVEEKHQSHKAAQDLLDRNDDTLLRYAALELRRCIEAVVYEKLLAYGDSIPADAARTWRPPQAFSALLAVEPYAASDAVVGISAESESGVPIPGSFRVLGTDRRPRPAWLKKTWNKLGSLLHAQWPFDKPEHATATNLDRAFLGRVLSELEPFVRTELTCVLAADVGFSCSVCGFAVRASERSLEISGEVTCLRCDSHYLVTKSGEDFRFRLDEPSVACQQCKRSITVQSRKLDVGYRFSCPSCGSEYEVTRRDWGITRVSTGGE